MLDRQLGQLAFNEASPTEDGESVAAFKQIALNGAQTDCLEWCVEREVPCPRTCGCQVPAPGTPLRKLMTADGEVGYVFGTPAQRSSRIVTDTHFGATQGVAPKRLPRDGPSLVAKAWQTKGVEETYAEAVNWCLAQGCIKARKARNSGKFQGLTLQRRLNDDPRKETKKAPC